MEINHLREFVVLSQTSSFMEAADILYSSQSTLSKHIKNLELELGIPLFDRTTRKVRISKFGQLLLPYAKQIVELQDKYNAILQNNLDSDRDILTLGSIPALAQYNITDVLVKFKKSRSQSTINVIQAAGSDDLREMLRQKKFELAFIRDIDGVDDDIVKIPFAVDTMVVVLPITHPLAKEKKISLRVLENEEFLLVETQTMLYKLSVQACQQSGFSPKIVYTDHKLDNIIDLVSKGMGITLEMKRLAYYLFNPKIAIVEITPPITTQIYLCHLKDVVLSNAAKHFILCATSHEINV